MARFAFSFALCFCLVAAALCDLGSDSLLRSRRGVSYRRQRPTQLGYGSRVRQAPVAPVYSAPAQEEEESLPVQDEPEAEEPAQDQEEHLEDQQQEEEQEEEITPAPVRAFRPRARPARPAKPAKPVKPQDDGHHGGATAIATAYSKGKGAVANSHAAAYGGSYTGGLYKHHY